MRGRVVGAEHASDQLKQESGVRMPGYRVDRPRGPNAERRGRLFRGPPTWPSRCSTRWWTPVSPGERDVEPILVALGVGALDGRLEEIGTVVNNRIVARIAIDELRAASRLHPSDRVRLGRNLQPRYLDSPAATSIGRDGDKWIV